MKSSQRAPGGRRRSCARPEAPAAVRPEAALLLGPTGSGKTPLGELLARRGMRGRPCVHFDFGAQLRLLAASPQPPAGVDAGEVEVVRDVLERGALLEAGHFCIAGKILKAFMTEQQASRGALVVLNGLPRHEGQARAIEPIVEVREVICLAAPPETVVERILRDSGGDRGGRTDDDVESVRRRIATYTERTSPLVDFYRRRGCRVETVAIGVGTSAEDVLKALEAAAG